MVYTTHTPQANAAAGKTASWDGDLSCEVGDNNGFRVSPSVYTQVASSVAQHGAAPLSTIATQTSTTAANGNNVDTFINDVVTEWTYDYSKQPSERLASAFYKNCLNKTDIITFINAAATPLNAPNLNLYTIERLVKDKSIWSNFKRYGATSIEGLAGAMSDTTDGTDYDKARGMEFGTNVINLDISTNWGTDLGASAGTANVGLEVSPYFVYKFVPHAASTYEYVAECSNRGLCDGESGVCECFPGYTNDNCDTQSSIAL
jgi:hypothetical protein